MTDIPIYEVSGPWFEVGVTNFTLENVYAACRSAKIYARKDVHIELDLAVHDSLDVMSQIERDVEGNLQWMNFTVSIAPNYTPKTYSDSLISDTFGNKVILRTRQY